MKGKRKSKNIEVRKPYQTVLDGNEQWVNAPSKEMTKRFTKQDLEFKAEVSPHLKTKNQMKNQKPDAQDDEAGNYKNLVIQADPIGSTRGFRQLKESHKPQRIQVTPGKWNTK